MSGIQRWDTTSGFQEGIPVSKSLLFNLDTAKNFTFHALNYNEYWSQ